MIDLYSVYSRYSLWRSLSLGAFQLLSNRPSYDKWRFLVSRPSRSLAASPACSSVMENQGDRRHGCYTMEMRCVWRPQTTTYHNPLESSIILEGAILSHSGNQGFKVKIFECSKTRAPRGFLGMKTCNLELGPALFTEQSIFYALQHLCFGGKVRTTNPWTGA